MGRSAFFSEQRVRKIFKELADLFVACLKEKCLDVYFDHLKEKGRFFSRMGVPFEEVIVSLHLFEEVCLEQFLEAFPNRSKLPRLILALEELHSHGLAALANSYFDTVKREMQKITDGLREENETLRNELAQTKDSYFVHTAKELTSMQLVISGISHKLRSRVYQQSRIQKVLEALDNEPQLGRLLKIATDHLLALSPADSGVYYAFFDEERKKVNLYGQSDSENETCDILQTFYFSELSAAFQDTLYDATKRSAYFKGYSEIPKPVLDLVLMRKQREFLLIPIRKYQDVHGFILLTTEAEDFLTRANIKFFQRIGHVIANAVLTARLFAKTKKQNEFASLLDELNRRNWADKSVELALDFYLGSLIELLGAERSSLMRYDASRQELRVCAAKGYKVYPISGIPIRWGEGVAGISLKESKIISITHLKESEKMNLLLRAFKRREAPESRVKSLLCLPLADSRTPLGVVNISTINFHKSFEKSEIDMAHQLVSRMTDILKNL